MGITNQINNKLRIIFLYKKKNSTKDKFIPREWIQQKGLK